MGDSGQKHHDKCHPSINIGLSHLRSLYLILLEIANIILFLFYLRNRILVIITFLLGFHVHLDVIFPILRQDLWSINNRLRIWSQLILKVILLKHDSNWWRTFLILRDLINIVMIVLQWNLGFADCEEIFCFFINVINMRIWWFLS